MKKEKKLITYLTCTYNRKDNLKKLYASLAAQSVNNFKWLVVDDGSQDGTDVFFEDLKKKAIFPICYLKKENGGKHRAINYSIEKLNTPLTMIIDSDDWLTKNCSKIIGKYWKKYNDVSSIGSFTFERGRSTEDDPMVRISTEIVAPRFEYIEKNNMYGDFNDVFFTKVLKKYRLPEFKGEKFISEGPLYFEMSRHYNTVFINKVIAIGDYRDDGLTKNIRELQVKNYKGTLFTLKQMLSTNYFTFGKLKHAILYDYVAIASKASLVKSIADSGNVVLTSLCILPSMLFLLKDKIEKYFN